jgi:hypothetical protein
MGTWPGTCILKLRDYRDPATLKELTDGEIYSIIANGKGKMTGEEGRMKPEQNAFEILTIRFTENPLRSENTRVQIIREIMVATTMSSLLSVPDVFSQHLGNTDERPRPLASISFRRRSNFTLTTALLPDVDHPTIWRDVLPPTSRTSNSATRIPETSRTSTRALWV